MLQNWSPNSNDDIYSQSLGQNPLARETPLHETEYKQTANTIIIIFHSLSQVHFSLLLFSMTDQKIMVQIMVYRSNTEGIYLYNISSVLYFLKVIS